MKWQLFIACLVFYSQMTQETVAQGEQTAPPPTCIRNASSGVTFEIRNISAVHAACMEGTHAKSSDDSKLCSCMASATKNGMNSFRVDSGVCYLYLALPPADDTGTQQIYVARNPTGNTDAPVCSPEKCCKDGSTKTAGGLCFVMVKTPKLTWEAALAECKKTPGSRLVEAPTPEIVEELHQYLMKNRGNDYLFWVGLKNTSDVWAWVESGEQSRVAWHVGGRHRRHVGDRHVRSPISLAGHECGMFTVEGTLANLFQCDSEQPYICSGPVAATSFCPAGN